MLDAVDVLGLALVTTLVPAALMSYVAWQNRDTPGSRWFAALVCAIAGWSSVYGISVAADGAALTFAAVQARDFFTDAVAIAWFLLALEYVRRRTLPARSRWLWLFAFPVVSQAVVQLRPGLVFPAWHVDDLGVFHATFGPWFYVQTLFSYVLVVAGLALFIDDYRSAQGIRRNQTGILIVGVLISFGANILFVAGFTPYPDLDLTPLAFLVTTLLFGYALFRYRLLELLPIARKTVLAQMDDAVVTLDEADRVVDVNDAAASLFGVPESAAVGTPGREFFSDFPALVEQFESTTDVDTEIEVVRNGETHHFHLRISPVSSDSDLVEGRVIVLRDVTELKDREEQLDLLKQVLSRVLRHNIRNDVSVVHGYAEEIARQTSGDPAALAERIQDKSDDIASRSKKASTIERVLTGEADPVTHDLSDVIDEAIAAVRGTVGPFTVSRECDTDCQVRALPTLSVALANLIENAVEHSSTSPDSQVRQDAVEHSTTSPDSQAHRDAVEHSSTNPDSRACQNADEQSVPSSDSQVRQETVERDAESVPEVELSVTSDAETVTIAVHDEGPGIPESELNVFEHGEETPLQHSSGVGLWLVVLIARRSGGEVHFENDDDGSVVRLTLEKA